MPGGAGAGHGGSVCAGSGTSLGSTNGVTWMFGGGTATSSTTCPTSTVKPAPFDTERFAALYWGADPRNLPKVAMDGQFGGPGETLKFSSADSALAAGKLVWTGNTVMLQACKGAGCIDFKDVPVNTRLTLQVTTTATTPQPVKLVALNVAGIADQRVGAVVSVAPALRNFTARILVEATTDGVLWEPATTFYNAYRHNSAFPQLLTSFTGAFWYVNRAPIAGFSVAGTQAYVPVSFHADYRDADGAVTAIGWDFTNDGAYGESDRSDAQWSFPPGTHTVRFRVVDDERPTAGITVISKQITVTPQDRDGDGYFPPADCNDSDATLNPSARDVPQNGVDENCDRVDATWPHMSVTLAWFATPGPRSTKFSYLKLKAVPPGSAITVKCSGRRCPKRVKITGRSGVVNIKAYKGRRLPAGDVIRARVANPGYLGVIKTLTVRRGKPPKPGASCFLPDSGAPAPCES